jgi:peptidoglycan hydrolase CwlO-like protein
VQAERASLRKQLSEQQAAAAELQQQQEGTAEDLRRTREDQGREAAARAAAEKLAAEREAAGEQLQRELAAALKVGRRGATHASLLYVLRQ